MLRLHLKVVICLVNNLKGMQLRRRKVQVVYSVKHPTHRVDFLANNRPRLRVLMLLMHNQQGRQVLDFLVRLNSNNHKINPLFLVSKPNPKLPCLVSKPNLKLVCLANNRHSLKLVYLVNNRHSQLVFLANNQRSHKVDYLANNQFNRISSVSKHKVKSSALVNSNSNSNKFPRQFQSWRRKLRPTPSKC